MLLFKLSNSPAMYQCYINNVLMQYLDDFYTAYLDDILIYFKDPIEHIGHVHKVLQHLHKASL